MDDARWMSDLLRLGFGQGIRGGLLQGSMNPLISGLHRMPSMVSSEDSDSGDASIRSRSRGRRRQARPLGGDTVLDFGRHEGRTYQELANHEPGYVRWALSVRRPQGRLRAFQTWLLANSAVGPESPGTPGFLTDTSGEDGGNAPEAAPRQRGPNAREQSLLNELPRIAFSPAIFSGDPHPTACPICMEDFGPSATSGREPAAGGDSAAGPSSGGGSELEIVLTPCLHAFHASCLTNWLARPSAARACPTCRWDIGDDGASQALGHAATENPQRVQSRPQTIRSLLAPPSPVAISSDSDSN